MARRKEGALLEGVAPSLCCSAAGALLPAHHVPHRPLFPHFYRLAQDRDDGTFGWTDGSSFKRYPKWGPGQPDRRSRYNCITSESKYNGRWGTATCESRLPYICRRLVQPTPSQCNRYVRRIFKKRNRNRD